MLPPHWDPRYTGRNLGSSYCCSHRSHNRDGTRVLALVGHFSEWQFHWLSNKDAFKLTAIILNNLFFSAMAGTGIRPTAKLKLASRLASEDSTTELPVPCWANRCISEGILVKCIWWKKRGKKGHTNNPALSALPWLGTPSWDDGMIPSELSPSNLVKGFIWFFFVFVFLSFSYLTLSQTSFTFLYFPSLTYFPLQ